MTVYNIKKHFGAVGDGVADDSPSLVSAANALVGTRGHTLHLPKGIYLTKFNSIINGRNLASASLLVLLEGIRQVRIVGDGGRSANTIIRMNSVWNQTGARGQKQNGNNWARTTDIAAGAMSTQLIDPTKYTLYNPGDYTLLSGLNIQDGYSVTPGGYGFPANLQVFEYIRIDTVSSSGLVTFKTPVRYNYLSTWPNINIGNNFEINAGGPAGMYSLFSSWDLDVEWEGIRFENTSAPQIYNGCRRIVYRDCTFPSGACPIPTQNGYWGTDRCIGTTIMETDKLIEEMEMVDTTWRGIDFQSASVRRSTLTNCIIDVKLAGSGADFGVVSGCTIGGTGTSFGAWAYGVCGAVHCDNTYFAGIASGGGGFAEGGPTGSGGFSNFADKVDGTIVIPNGTNESNLTDNGVGKTRITIAPEYSAVQWKVGKVIPFGTTYQYMNTVGITPIGTNVLTFASVPGWIVPGTSVLGQDSSSNYTGMPATGSTVTAVTATTVTLSANMTGNRPNNSSVAFSCAPLSGKCGLITAVNLANNTVDTDVNFPVGYIYGSSAGTASWVAARWAVPGNAVYWTGVMGTSKSFKVLAVRQDVNFTYVDTNEPGGMPLSLVPNTGAINIGTPGGQTMTFSGITGPSVQTDSLNDPNSQNKPFGSYVKLQLTAGPLAPNRTTSTPQFWGNVVSIVVDVVTPYTGSSANCFLHFSQFDNTSFNVDGVRTFLGWAIDIRTPGKRIITPTNTPAITPTNPTAKGNDGPLLFPNWSQILWANGTFNFFYSNGKGLGGGNNGTQIIVANEPLLRWPLINIEVYTDHGFGVAVQKAVAADAGAYALTGTPATLRPMAVFSPVVVATEQHVFGMSASDPTQYHVPGNGAPAVSTSSFYQTSGLYNFRPYDLDTMGGVGAAVKAANGGRRYVWVCSGDHPINGYGWRGGEATYVGYSFQPWDLPRKLNEILYFHINFQTPEHNVNGGFKSYEFPTIFYNPDDPDGLPIYLFIETGPDHYTCLWRSADFITFTVKEISHWHSPTGTFTSFVRYVRRNGLGDFMSIAASGTTATSGFCNSIYTSTDGIHYTSTYTPIYGTEGTPDSAGSFFHCGGFFDVGFQKYAVARESASNGVAYCTIISVDPVTFNKLDSPSKVRLASNWSTTGFPGPLHLQECIGYEEDGILYTWPTYGFPSDVNTTALGQQRGGAPYADGGGLDHQFMDRMIVRVNDTAARQAAPAGVSVSCAAGVVTIAWKDALPQNTYRVYRGTTATTQTTLIGDVTGTSITNSPPIGRYWYKVVTLDGGTERKSRVLSVYASSSTAFVNEHIDRVLDDGGDISTINRSFLDSLDGMFDTVGIRNVLELCAHPAAGVKTSGSPIKIYDVGTTRLPRSQDFKAYTANTTYSATGVNGGPCWINANNNSYGYWGDLKRGNTIQMKRQLTIIAAYERTQTTEDFTFVGTGPIWTNTVDGGEIIALKHTAGSPGTIEFSLSDETSTKTASVTASGSGLQIAVGTYDGTSMLAYTGSTAGSAITTLDPNPNFGQFRTGPTLNLTQGSLAGGRNWNNNGSGPDFGPSPFPAYFPFLGSGSVHCYTLRRTDLSNTATFTETHAKGKIQCVMVFEKALTSTQISDVVSFLQSPIGAKSINADVGVYALTGAAATLTKTNPSSTLKTGLVSFWELEEASGTRADSHGTNPLVPTGTPTNIAGKVGNCVVTTTSTNYLTCADNADLNASGKDFTIAGWVYWSANNEIAKKGISFGQNEWVLDIFFTGSSNVFRLRTISSDGNTTDAAAQSATPLSVNTWYFVCATYTLATKTATVSTNAGTRATATGASTIPNKTDPFRLGNLNGRLDQFGWWDRVLTPTEEAALYNGGAGLSYAAMGGSPPKSIVADAGAYALTGTAVTLTKAAPIFPTISGMNLHVDAVGLPDNTLVTTLVDSSGAGNNLTQAATNNKPTSFTSGVDAKPFVGFGVTGAPGNSVLANVNYSTDKRAATFFWVGDIQGNDLNSYAFNVSANNFVIMLVDGFIKYFPGIVNVTRIFSGRRFAVVAVLDATSLKIYVDAIGSVFTFGALAAGNVTGLTLGDSSGSYKGRLYEFAAWNRALNATEVGQLLDYSAAAMGTGISQLTPTGRVIFDGDSTTFGVGATRNRSLMAYLAVNPSWYTHNFGITGQQITTMSTDQAAEINTPYANATNWLVIEAGYNDLGAGAQTGAVTEARLNTYCTAAIAAGFSKSKIVVMTLSTSGTPTERDNFNTLIRANYTNYAGWLIDQAADSQLGVTPGGGFLVGANFFDGVHKNDTGYTKQAALVRSVIGGALPW